MKIVIINVTPIYARSLFSCSCYDVTMVLMEISGKFGTYFFIRYTTQSYHERPVYCCPVPVPCALFCSHGKFI